MVPPGCKPRRLCLLHAAIKDTGQFHEVGLLQDQQIENMAQQSHENDFKSPK
jgi:hypothetical protein